ncbi:MAG TPA: sugar ABC transporter ATP-binding protein [Candidatus Limnocylindrales bacterium]|jgi:ribose transport system ATP-binding protein
MSPETAPAGRNPAKPARLELRAISRRFGSTVALDRVDLVLRPGEVHALLGANGAGKSTLIGIVAGVRRADSGEILVDGEPVEITSPADARAHGIGVIHQELSILPSLTVAENFLLKRAGRTRPRPILPPRAEERGIAEAALARVGLHISGNSRCDRLGFGERQLIEIAIAVSSSVRVLFMDEPTSGLSDVEQARLFDAVRTMRDQVVSIVYVTHRMDEVFQLADRITVLREGRNVGLFERATAERSAVIAAIVGRKLSRELGESRAAAGDAAVAEEAARAPLFGVDHFFSTGVHDVSLAVAPGEIVGMYGVVGAGCTALMEALFSARPWAGQMRLGGRQVQPRSPGAARQLGIALVPSDHRRRGLVGGMSIKENLLLGRGRWRSGFVRRVPADLRTRLTTLLARLRVAARGLEQSVDELSGGTQQKVVVGRWLVDQPRVLLLDDPTQGIDVGAKADIYELLRTLREQGVATLLVSSELTELVNVADRVLVMRDGRIRGEVSGSDLDRSQILHLATHP